MVNFLQKASWSTLSVSSLWYMQVLPFILSQMTALSRLLQMKRDKNCWIVRLKKSLRHNHIHLSNCRPWSVRRTVYCNIILVLLLHCMVLCCVVRDVFMYKFSYCSEIYICTELMYLTLHQVHTYRLFWYIIYISN